MKTSYSFQIYSATSQLPANWDDLATDTVFLTKEYLEVLEKSAPQNMTCHFIGLFQNNELVGIAISQYLDLYKLQSFGERDQCVKTFTRNLILKNFCSRVLIIGNNMLTGQNAFSFSNNTDEKEALKTLKLASEALVKIFKSKGNKVQITIFKDFFAEELESFNIPEFKNYYQFSIQPNMVFAINENWKSEQDYIEALSKKYRDQYKRARKKADGIEKRKMNLENIIKYEDNIYDLYFHVAKNAPFNTFFLTKNHFRVFKEKFKDKFLFYGYFLDDKLIGFNTLIKNGEAMDTYFLGFKESIQREKMLYLNMLYDMIAYTINKGFKEIIFARTALEIKSSVGAKAVEMFGFIHYSNDFINTKMPKLIGYMGPKTIWQERNPFK